MGICIQILQAALNRAADLKGEVCRHSAWFARFIGKKTQNGYP